MPQPLAIFLSHSFQDYSTLLALGAKLGDFEVIYDTQQQDTSDLYKAISRNLNRCDVVIPIITSNWLSSHECRDELVRANERRKIIVPFTHKDLPSDGPLKMPWYLAENLAVRWSQSELPRAIAELVDKLRSIAASAWQQTCYRGLRLIGDDIQRSDATPAWKSQLCQKVLEVAQSHVHNILVTDRCEFPVAAEQAYLRFADPIFGRAETIIAICIAKISTFWTDPDFRADAGKYLRNQDKSADSICRLFVFDSVSELISFRSMLQKHHLSYGKDADRSGVFICSSGRYLRLLSKWTLEVDDHALRQDFGLLSFGVNAQKIHASLDRHYFRYAAYDEQDENYIRNRIIIEHFESLRRLELAGC